MGVATFIATLVVAAATAWAAWSAARAAGAARDSLEEVRRDRELQVAPYLSFEYPLPASDPNHLFTARLRNLGRGAAIRCIVIIGRENHEGRLSGRFDIGPGKEVDARLVPVPAGVEPGTPHEHPTFRKELFVDPKSPIFPGGVVMYCSSISRAAVYRFQQGRAADEPWYFGQPRPYWADALHRFAPDLTPHPAPPLPTNPAGPPLWSGLLSPISQLLRRIPHLPLPGRATRSDAAEGGAAAPQAERDEQRP